MFTEKNWQYLGIESWQFVLLLLALAAVVAIFFVALHFIHKNKGKSNKLTTRQLTYAAICLAAALALMYFPIYSMPYGGSVTLASMLPIMIFCYFFGFRKSLVLCFAITLLQITYRPYILTPWSAILDYILPYMALSLVGIFAYKPQVGAKTNKSFIKEHYKFFVGVLFYFVARYLSHTVAGVIFWSEGIDFSIWSGDLQGAAAWGYSLTYNGIYMVLDTLIAVIAGIFVLRNEKLTSMLSNTAIESMNI